MLRDRITDDSGRTVPVTHSGYLTGALVARGLAVAAIAIAVSGCSVKLKDIGLMDDGAAPESVAYMMTDPDPSAPETIVVPASGQP